MKREEEFLVRNALLSELRRGRITRRQFMTQMLAIGLGLGGVSALAACAPPAPTAAPAAEEAPAEEAPAEEAPAEEGRILTPTFYQWINDLHPAIEQVNAAFPGGVNYQIAPTEGFDVTRFVAEAKGGQSTWDVYAGVTPFVEMASLIEADVIEPWDPYIPQEVLDDIAPAIREECTVDGKLYSWPFLLDVIIQAWNSNITSEAGLPDDPPPDWDTYLARSQTVLDSGAALYGCTFDAHGWRSLCPIAHSINSDTYYTLEGDPSGVPLFDFTSDSALEALEIMKQMLDLSSANALQPGATDGGVNQTPDEISFSAQNVAYYIKYQNAPLRFAELWDDPSALRMGALPSGGEGATVFWTTGASLFKHGQNKEAAAEYLKSLTYEPQIWQDSISGSPSGKPGQLPPYQSIYDEWAQNPPDWLLAEPWVQLVTGSMEFAKAIPNHSFGLQQFVIGQPLWEEYLKGDVDDPMVAMQNVKDAVAEEVMKTLG
jgi:ABC-type glycerol-3-phosphate transport system substrate-binding protein